ncbi:MAG: 2-hydroxy-3-oxopropionate reductase [Oceanospirillaceae bacterium UBA2001]|nr:MAG: 2-hydroxy-3-oxopropionate reductase [Oceanospirillaceae bacterium UBA2001]
MNTIPSVGFIGLGLMGHAMAKQLIKAGYSLCIHSRTASKAEPLVALGATYAQTPVQLAKIVKNNIIIVCVTDSTALEDVMLGAQGLLSHIDPGCLVIDMGTSRFDLTQTLAKQAQAQGAHFLDAPVSGGQIGAQQGTLSIMAGGHPAQLERAQPLFNAMAKQTTHVGGNGCGQLAKTANQMIVGATLNIVAEALFLAKKNGADPAKVRAALGGGFADSKILQLHGQRMVDKAFTPGARATTQLKDLQQAADLAQSCELNLPLNQACLSQWQGMVDADLGGLDQAGILAWVELTNEQNGSK